MEQRNRVIDLGIAIHQQLERDLKEQPMSSKQRRGTPAEEEAKRLHMEAVRLAKMDFAVKTPRLDDMHSDEDDEPSPHDILTEQSLQPSINDQLGKMGSSLTGRSIMEEITEARMLGKLEPFVEGTPIGACHNGPRPCAAPPLMTHDQIMDEKQLALRRLQKRNERALDRLERELA